MNFPNTVSPEEYKERFQSCGADVVIEPGVWIEHPECFSVGDRVRIRHGVTFIGQQEEVVLGNDIDLYPGVFVQGSGRLVVDNNVTLYPHNYLSIGGKNGLIDIGPRTHFAPGCALYGGGTLRIGEGCAMAAHTVLATVAHDHRIVDRPLVDGGKSAPITLKGDNWTGANAVIIGGVTVAEGCVVGAGAVLTRDTEPFGVYLGVPARLAYSRK